MYVLGAFRRTALWGVILSILGVISMRYLDWLVFGLCFVSIYIIFVLLHIGICKLKYKHDTAGDIYLSSLGCDLMAPITKMGTFLAVITKKWIIHDDSKFHNFIDAAQVVTGGIWSICIWGISIFFIVNFFR